MLALALRSVSECVVVTDMQDTILFVNDAFLNTYNYGEQELLGKNIDMVRSPNTPAEVGAEILPTTLNRGAWKGEVLNRRRGGEDFPVSLSTSVVRNEQHEPIALIGVAVDITERKRNERQLVEARETAEAAAKAKSEFLATMSHEIRTPMNGVIGMTELLLNTDLTRQQLEFVRAIQSCGESLLTIINDILDFSKIDSGRIDLESNPFEVRTVVSEVLTLLTPKAREKRLELTGFVSDVVPERILGDVTRFKQVLINLVGNGLKFTEKGKVSVHLDLESRDTDSMVLRCAVKDTGIGIPPEKLDRLFKAFSQVDTSINRRFGGTGLGLAISTSLVQLMGGRILVDSVAGGGSTFTFTVNARLASAAKEPLVGAGVSSPDKEFAKRLPLRILVAEDNIVNQRVIVHILAQMGYKPDLVENGAEAVKAVESLFYDLIFMDVHMPEMNGLDATLRIRQLRPGVGGPRIIALTADALVGDREKCLSAGMNDYLTKPIRADDIRGAIERWGVQASGP